jgi:glutamine cyclotransferase
VKGEVLPTCGRPIASRGSIPGPGTSPRGSDFSGLLTASRAGRTDVLNGIAYDAARDRLFVTGKLWPKLFEVRLNSK